QCQCLSGRDIYDLQTHLRVSHILSLQVGCKCANLNRRSVGWLNQARETRRSHRPKPAFRMVILDGDRRSDGRYLEISEVGWAAGEGTACAGVRGTVCQAVTVNRLRPFSIRPPPNRTYNVSEYPALQWTYLTVSVGLRVGCPAWIAT